MLARLTRAQLALLSLVAAAAIALAVVLAWPSSANAHRTNSGDSSQCDKPVSQRTGGWFCYGPTPK